MTVKEALFSLKGLKEFQKYRRVSGKSFIEPEIEVTFEMLFDIIELLLNKVEKSESGE